jgi:hypothetical protein
VAGWKPGDPWPGTPGGVARDEWSGYIRVYLQAQIAAGQRFAMGAAATDRLDAGNTMSDAAGRAAPTSLLWVDLTCDLTDLEISLGSSAGEGILSKPDAGTLVAKLYDPEGKYDPYNPDTPYALGNRTRLTPGVPVRAWCEVITSVAVAKPPVTVLPLFTGTADRWQHNWTAEPSERAATLTATDWTKQFARFDRAALDTPVGQGDTVTQRLQRIVDYFGWAGFVQTFGASTVTLQSTGLAQSAWEMVQRAATDELGFVYFQPLPPTVAAPGQLQVDLRSMWSSLPAPLFTIGCGPGNYDIATEVIPASFDEQITNAAYVARAGGTQQVAKSGTSIAKFWEQSVNRSDLGLADDAQVAQWALSLVTLYAYPQLSLDKITLQPAVHPQPWQAWLQVAQMALIYRTVRVLWEAGGYTADTTVRLVGWTHKITATEWTVEWRTVAGMVTSTYTFTAGPAAQDLLDAGYTLG